MLGSCRDINCQCDDTCGPSGVRSVINSCVRWIRLRKVPSICGSIFQRFYLENVWRWPASSALAHWTYSVGCRYLHSAQVPKAPFKAVIAIRNGHKVHIGLEHTTVPLFQLPVSGSHFACSETKSNKKSAEDRVRRSIVTKK